MHKPIAPAMAPCGDILTAMADVICLCRMADGLPGAIEDGLEDLAGLLGTVLPEGCTLDALVAEDDRPLLTALAAEALARGSATGGLRLAAGGAALAVDAAFCAAGQELLAGFRLRERPCQPGTCQKAAMEAIFHGVHDAVLIHDLEGRIVRVNDQAAALYGPEMTEPERMADLKVVEHLSAPGNPVDSLPALWAKVLEGEPQLFEWRARRLDGREFDAEVFLKRIPYGSGCNAILATVRDVSARKQAESRLKLAARVFENSVEGITITDAAGNIVAVNPAFTTITGYAPEEVIGRNPRILKSERHDGPFYTRMWQCLRDSGQWQGEIWNRRKNGEAYPEWLSISTVRDERGAVQYYVAVFHDISEIKASQERLQHQAYHDALTGLPNRLLLKDRLAKAIAHAARKGCLLAVLFLDIDKFKAINDSLGHPVGDQLLQAVAQRLRETLREEDTIARLGGDEFVVMIPEIGGEEAAVAAARRVLAAFARPFGLRGREVSVSTSVGISVYPADGHDPEVLIKNADMAMYRAKDQGRGTFCLYTPALNERAVRKLTMEAALRRAMDKPGEQGGLVVHYQPRLAMADGHVCGAEALVRWQLSDGTLLAPDEFLPLAEETGLIRPLGRIVIEEACRRARQLHDAGHHGLRVSVNISPRQFDDPGLVKLLAGAVETWGLPRGTLELEITEASLMRQLDESLRVLKSLRALGLALTVDDFGTGYSSLVYLKHFPLTGLKIDRGFVAGIPSEPSDMAIAQAIVAMARSLELRVTAVGVESPEQLAYLRALRCDEYQGYLASRPLEFQDFQLLLEGGERGVN